MEKILRMLWDKLSLALLILLFVFSLYLKLFMDWDNFDFTLFEFLCIALILNTIFLLIPIINYFKKQRLHAYYTKTILLLRFIIAIAFTISFYRIYASLKPLTVTYYILAAALFLGALLEFIDTRIHIIYKRIAEGKNYFWYVAGTSLLSFLLIAYPMSPLLYKTFIPIKELSLSELTTPDSIMISDEHTSEDYNHIVYIKNPDDLNLIATDLRQNTTRNYTIAEEFQYYRIKNEAVTIHLLFTDEISHDKTLFITSEKEPGSLSLELNKDGTTMLLYTPRSTSSFPLFRKYPLYYPVVLSDRTQEMLFKYKELLD